MLQKRVHILSAVNAANVSKSGSKYTIKDVCGATDGIVMNSRMYPGEELAAGIATLEGKPAPAGHPKDSQGRHISALNGEALASAWIGSYCVNARHVGGRSLVDIVVNEAQARAHPDGAKLVERLDAAIAGTNTEPIHVSTGLFFNEVKEQGESRGKKFTSVVRNPRYDHLAILLNEQGAGTPEDGVGMFVNEAGQAEEVEVAEFNAEPEDRRSAGLKLWIQRLVGNSNVDASFDSITSGLYALMPSGSWVRDVFDRYCIWSDDTGKLWKQDYSVASDCSVAFLGQAIEVTRKVEYEPITNSREVDPVKDKILAALNAAGIAVAGLDEDQLLSAFTSLKVKPLQDLLTAANSKIAGFEVAANAARDAELTALATPLAVNSALTLDELKGLGLERLKELSAKAAPVVVATNTAKPGDEFADYSINEIMKEGK